MKRRDCFAPPPLRRPPRTRPKRQGARARRPNRQRELETKARYLDALHGDAAAYTGCARRPAAKACQLVPSVRPTARWFVRGRERCAKWKVSNATGKQQRGRVSQTRAREPGPSKNDVAARLSASTRIRRYTQREPSPRPRTPPASGRVSSRLLPAGLPTVARVV